jgi:DNA-binding NarL/FixJ family response regulator
MTRIKVLIVDDHPIVREGVAAVLERERDIDVVGAADTVDEGVRVAAKLHPDVILLDLKMPGTDSLDGIASFVGEDRAIVVFTAYEADDEVFRAIRGGARGYLLKGSPAVEIARAIRQVHAGESYLSPRIAAKLVKGVVQPRGRTGLLSPRERGVLRLVAAGLSNRQIAHALSISERTVKFHVTAIFNKLGAENRAQAVAIAAERGLLPTQ